ncbi:MAG: hypothetical protein OWU32_13130 [Firmicutes bacterium]|nr:hypothetical protein [Bacillota bacterium]
MRRSRAAASADVLLGDRTRHCGDVLRPSLPLHGATAIGAQKGAVRRLLMACADRWMPGAPGVATGAPRARP